MSSTASDWFMVRVREKPRRSNHAQRHLSLLLFSILTASGLWILFVATSNLHEMLVGLFCVSATICFTLFVCRSSGTDFIFRPRDLFECWRVPWYILSLVSEITWILVKDILHIAPARNLYRVCGFDASAHDPIRKARAVLAIAYTTVAPNFIVIGVDLATSRMLFHQLAPSPVSRMTKALGARG